MAKKSYPSSLLTIFAVVVHILYQVDAENDGDPFGRPETMSVTIYNEVPIVLEVHCYSKDNDLNVQYLRSRTSYSFSFHSNLWGSTLFWCTFSYTYGVRWNSFPAWTDSGFWGKKKRPCEQCVWIARTDAFYRAENGSLPIAMHPWRTDKPPNMNPM